MQRPLPDSILTNVSLLKFKNWHEMYSLPCFCVFWQELLRFVGRELAWRSTMLNSYLALVARVLVQTLSYLQLSLLFTQKWLNSFAFYHGDACYMIVLIVRLHPDFRVVYMGPQHHGHPLWWAPDSSQVGTLADKAVIVSQLTTAMNFFILWSS